MHQHIPNNKRNIVNNIEMKHIVDKAILNKCNNTEVS